MQSAEILLDREEAARRLSLNPESFFDRRYLARIGLPRVKVGRLVRFRESDVERLIQRGVEKIPAATR
jgi:hypothetical protein